MNMPFDKIVVPADGQKITVHEGQLDVPDNPILLWIEGDGIGPDIMRASKRIWDAAVQKCYAGERRIAWCEIYAGEKAARIFDGDYFPRASLEAIREFLVGIKGPLTTPVGGGFRKAFIFALEHDRKSVTFVHKGNIQKFTEGAFMQWGYDVARDEFSGATITERQLWDEFGGNQPEGKVLVKDRIADIMFQQMLLRPAEYDVIATPNLNGDYLSDAVAAEVGGVGIAPGANIGDYMAVFEATHGTAPKYANQDKVNPGSLLLSGALMLDYIGWHEAAKAVENAYRLTVADKIVTYDFARQMDGATEVRTSEFASALIQRL
jgi:isocitrate dehydrogenase